MGIEFKYPVPGDFIKLRGKSYEIIRHLIEWGQSGMTVKTVIREVDDNAEFVDDWEQEINLDMWDYKVF